MTVAEGMAPGVQNDSGSPGPIVGAGESESLATGALDSDAGDAGALESWVGESSGAMGQS